jgi:hypothetical protein
VTTVPDWLNLDDDQISDEPPPTRRQRRQNQRANARAAAAEDRTDQLHRARSDTSPGAYLIGAAVLVAVVVAAAYLLPKVFAGPSAAAGPAVAAPASTPTAGASDQPAPTPATSSVTSTAPGTTTGTPTAYKSPGADLAKTFLTGLLTRSSRDDDNWQQAVQPYTTPELIEHLKTLGADGIGFEELSSWQPIKFQKTTIVDQPANTPSRVVSSWIVTVTDGHQTMRKPFGVNEYLGDHGTWKVAVLQMPYTSEG